MVIIYESNSKGYNHLPFNECILKIIDEIINDDKVFYADSEHIKHLKTISNNINFIDIKIADFNNKVKALLLEIKNQIYIKWKNRNNNITQIILTNSPPHTMFLVKLLYRKCKITFFIHGTLEECLHKKRFYELGYYCKFSLKFLNNKYNIKYIVLGDSIKKNILKIIPEIYDNLYSIHHPLKLVNINIKCNSYHKLERKIRIGTIGSGDLSKGNNLIFKIEKELGLLVNQSIELYHIGRLRNISIPSNTKVNIMTQDEMFNTEEYNILINKLDYILFLFPKDSYKLTASGSFIDAIKFQKPIIALKNDYFQYVFDSVGDIGYLCDNVTEISNIIISIAKTNMYPQPEQFIKNIELAIDKFNYLNVMNDLKNMKVWS